MMTVKFDREKLAAAIDVPWIQKKGLAAAIGISRTTLGKYLDGESTPSIDTLSKLATLLRMDITDFLS